MKPKLASTEFKGDPDKPVQHKLTIEIVRASEDETLVAQRLAEDRARAFAARHSSR